MEKTPSLSMEGQLKAENLNRWISVGGKNLVVLGAERDDLIDDEIEERDLETYVFQTRTKLEVYEDYFTAISLGGIQ